jgi:hypothetical protein
MKGQQTPCQLEKRNEMRVFGAADGPAAPAIDAAAAEFSDRDTVDAGR